MTGQMRAVVITQFGGLIGIRSANAIRGVVAQRILISSIYHDWYEKNKAVIDLSLSRYPGRKPELLEKSS